MSIRNSEPKKQEKHAKHAEHEKPEKHEQQEQREQKEQYEKQQKHKQKQKHAKSQACPPPPKFMPVRGRARSAWKSHPAGARAGAVGLKVSPCWCQGGRSRPEPLPVREPGRTNI